jgi:hypothetical protein
MASKEEEFEILVDEDTFTEVVEVVEEAPVKAVSTLSLPEWKEAVAGLEKAGLLEKGADYVTVRNALTAFQIGVGIRGMAEGYPNEATLEALKGA